MSAAVPTVHEQMQDGTQEEQHIWQSAEDVRAMLSNEEKACNGEKGEQNQATWRPQPAPFRWWMVGRHSSLL
jgi:hypothetical protein